MKISKRGVTRIVFLTKKYAIKFPRVDYGWRLFIEGIRANLNEREIWMIANVPDNQINDVKEHLCPVVWSSWGAWFVVMKRCEPLYFDERSKQEQYEYHQIVDKLRSIAGDQKEDNYGYLNGKPVMFDYACTNLDYFSGQKDPVYGRPSRNEMLF